MFLYCSRRGKGLVTMTVFDRLGELSDQDSVSVSCPACGNRAWLDLRKLLIQYGSKMTFKGIQRRLRCLRCGEKRVEWRFHHSGNAKSIKLVDLLTWKDRPE
jgi:hypothetical protein